MGEVVNAKVIVQNEDSIVSTAGLTHSTTSNTNNFTLNDLIKDKYGNYVI